MNSLVTPCAERVLSGKESVQSVDKKVFFGSAQICEIRDSEIHGAWLWLSDLDSQDLSSARRIACVGMAGIDAEPSGDTGARSPGGQDLVRDFLAQEHRDGAGTGQHARELAAAMRIVDDQFAFVGRPPAVVEVGHQRHRPAGRPAKAVQVTPVAAAGRVEGEMGFELEQTQVEPPVQFAPEAFHPVQEQAAGQGGPGQPVHAVVALPDIDTVFGTPADACPAQGIRPFEFAHFRAQGRDQGRRQQVIPDPESGSGQGVGQFVVDIA